MKKISEEKKPLQVFRSKEDLMNSISHCNLSNSITNDIESLVDFLSLVKNIHNYDDKSLDSLLERVERAEITRDLLLDFNILLINKLKEKNLS